MIPRLSGVFSLLGGAVRRFPLVVVAALVGASCAIAANHGPKEGTFPETCYRIMQLALVSFPLFVGAGYLGEVRPRWRGAAWTGSLLALALIWRRIPQDHAPFVFVYGYLATILAVLTFASAVPGLGGSRSWWRVNVGTALALVLAFMASSIVEVGLQVALHSIHALFGFNLDRYHIDALSLVALLFAPLAVIALLPPAREEGPLPLEGFWRALGQWVLAPLGFIFIGILVAYAGLILMRWKLPDGLVATPVLALGAYGTAAMLLLQPWRDSHAAARWFGRIYPAAFLLSSILLFVALAERLRAYGVTFDRYTALAAGVWFVIAAALFLFRAANSGALIMAAAAAITLIGSVGPLSAGSLSLRSQSARLAALLKEQDRSKNAENIRSGVEFLAENFGLADLEKITGPLGLDSKLQGWELPREAAKKLGVAEDSSQQFLWNGAKPVSVAGYSAMHGNRSRVGCSMGKTKDGADLRVELDNGKPRVMAGDKEVVDLLPAVKSALASANYPSGEVEEPVLVPFSADGQEFVLVLGQANWTKGEDGVTALRSYDFFVLEK